MAANASNVSRLTQPGRNTPVGKGAHARSGCSHCCVCSVQIGMCVRLKPTFETKRHQALKCVRDKDSLGVSNLSVATARLCATMQAANACDSISVLSFSSKFIVERAALKPSFAQVRSCTGSFLAKCSVACRQQLCLYFAVCAARLLRHQVLRFRHVIWCMLSACLYVNESDFRSAVCCALAQAQHL